LRLRAQRIREHLLKCVRKCVQGRRDDTS
jgi:hypothetical protein